MLATSTAMWLSSSDPGGSIPFVAKFTELTYSIRTPKKLSLFPRRRSETKTLLNSISGEAREGEILAVLGASGSGKSTLIDALANRIAKGSLKGSIVLNNEPLESKLLKVISAYVMQDDLLYPMLTVEETLMFSAEFRLPRTLSKSKKQSRVQALIDQLGLRPAAKTIIGDEGHRGISGGERRRVSIGIDIIHDPIILFLDEPTSGLDSTKRLHGRQSSPTNRPKRQHCNYVDSPAFLPNHHPSGPSPLPIPRPIPENENWAEFALDLIRELESTPDGSSPLVGFHRSWKRLKLSSSSAVGGKQITSPSLKDAISTSISRGKLVSGALYLHAETAYNAYRRSSYVLSNAIVGLPSLILLSVAFAAATFFAVGLAGGAEGFFFFFLIVLASFWAGSGFVTFLSGVVSHVMIGYTVVVAILAYFLLFSGFFVTRDRISNFWIWFHHSLMKYPYEAVMQNEFGGHGKCFVSGMQMFDNTPLEAMPVALKANVLQAMSRAIGVSITSGTCITTGSGILEQQALTDLSKWNCLWITVAWGILLQDSILLLAVGWEQEQTKISLNKFTKQFDIELWH
ncbi:hypothetical protein HPP92_013862 [Vanilla planifolia]|uniref:ABC transporter domain-containing protein n=1 Tax=Vanilla planifolia TaxID=51239 RepID=A0A835QWC6_VANPL|nr:hypothetical protein HPP92_013862 [Vanilla planifolia]